MTPLPDLPCSETGVHPGEAQDLRDYLGDEWIARSDRFDRSQLRSAGFTSVPLRCTARKELIKAVYPQGPRLSMQIDCGQCWACQTRRLSNIEGRLAAEALVSTEIWLLTLSYDDAQGPDAIAGSEVRIPEHVQAFKKRFRRRLERAAVAHNKRHPDQQVPVCGTVKFFDVFERGESRGRGHWHVLVFFRSDVDPPDAVLAKGDRAACLPYLSRAVMPRVVYGVPPKTLPPEANEPSVLTFRATSIQRWDLWPLGGVQCELVSHWRDRGDGRVPKDPADMAQAMRYVLKYLRKQIPDGSNAHRDEGWTKRNRKGARASEAEPDFVASRTWSRGFGSAFARAYGRAADLVGRVRREDLNYRLVGYRVRRSLRSAAKVRQRALQRGADPDRAAWRMEDRKVFEMPPAMMDVALLGFIEVQRDKAHARGRSWTMEDVASYGELAGDAMLRYMRDEYIRVMDSPRGQDAREAALAADKGRRLVIPRERCQMLPRFRIGVDGAVCDGSRRRRARVRRSYEPVPILHKLRARSAELEAAKRFVGRHQMPARATDADYERLSSCLAGVVTADRARDALYKRQRRPLRPGRAKQIADALDRVRSRSGLSEEVRRQVIGRIEALRYEEVKAEVSLGRGRLGVPGLPYEQVEQWVNRSDDYGWIDVREAAIERYCDVIHEGGNWGVIANPRGQVFLRRWVSHCEGNRTVRVWSVDGPGELSRQRIYGVWATRELIGDEVQRALDGDVDGLVVASSDRADIFAGPRCLERCGPARQTDKQRLAELLLQWD